MNRLTADLLLLLAAAIWGLAFVFQKTAMEVVGPLTFIAARASVAALALAPVAFFEWWRAGRSQREGNPSGPVVAPALLPAGLVRAGAIAGVAFFLGAYLQQEGLKTATATNAGFLTALYVVFTPLLAWLVFRRRPGIVLIPAVILSFTGTWLLGGAGFGSLSHGDTLIAICAVFWAMHVILSERGAGFGRPATFTALQFVMVAVLAMAGAFAFETPTLAGLMAASGEILYVGLLSSALTFTLLTAALRYTRSSEAAVIVATESLFAALAGAVLLGERLGMIAWGGAAMIVLATIIVQLVPRSRQPSGL